MTKKLSIGDMLYIEPEDECIWTFKWHEASQQMYYLGGMKRGAHVVVGSSMIQPNTNCIFWPLFSSSGDIFWVRADHLGVNIDVPG